MVVLVRSIMKERARNGVDLSCVYRPMHSGNAIACFYYVQMPFRVKG